MAQKTASQVLSDCFDDSTSALNVNAQMKTGGLEFQVASHEVEISHTNDSIKIGDGTDLMSVNADGSINTRRINDLVPETYTGLYFTYVAAGDGAGKVETIVFKSGSTTVATITFSYNSSNKVTSIVRS